MEVTEGVKLPPGFGVELAALSGAKKPPQLIIGPSLALQLFAQLSGSCGRL